MPGPACAEPRAGLGVACDVTHVTGMWRVASCGPSSRHGPTPDGAGPLGVLSKMPCFQFCLRWGLGKGCVGSPRQSPAFPGSPHPSQRPSWLKQEVLVFGQRGEAETCASRNWPLLSWPCQPGSSGFRGRYGNRLGLLGLGCFTSQAHGGSAGETLQPVGLSPALLLCTLRPRFLGAMGSAALQ